MDQGYQSKLVALTALPEAIDNNGVMQVAALDRVRDTAAELCGGTDILQNITDGAADVRRSRTNLQEVAFHPREPIFNEITSAEADVIGAIIH